MQDRIRTRVAFATLAWAAVVSSSCGSDDVRATSQSDQELRTAMEAARAAARLLPECQSLRRDIERERNRELTYRDRVQDHLGAPASGWSLGRYSGNRMAATAAQRMVASSVERRRKLERELEARVEAEVRKSIGPDVFDEFARRTKAARARGLAK
ncbi:MAG: hypothetical protein H6832_03785 [Planctomycetes bacterium]|nr:hypothetical protein [Planctomycetota bacterium]